jgi:hypothetical protein
MPLDAWRTVTTEEADRLIAELQREPLVTLRPGGG